MYPPNSNALIDLLNDIGQFVAGRKDAAQITKDVEAGQTAWEELIHSAGGGNAIPLGALTEEREKAIYQATVDLIKIDDSGQHSLREMLGMWYDSKVVQDYFKHVREGLNEGKL